VLGGAGRVESDANNARTRFCMRSRFRIMDQSRGFARHITCCIVRRLVQYAPCACNRSSTLRDEAEQSAPLCSIDLQHARLTSFVISSLQHRSAVDCDKANTPGARRTCGSASESRYWKGDDANSCQEISLGGRLF
jgi:hypothetical protein